MTIVDKYRGKKSVTRFRVMGGAGSFTVLEALPETGRTHQIRVHAAALGFPVVCDSLYGNNKPVMLSSFKHKRRGDPFDEKPLLARLGLHAAELIIPGSDYPAQTGISSEDLRLCAPLARDMAALINQLNKIAGGC
jgi:23S rRNA-/tRNA-specific pseudouridylate synthase